MMADSLVEFDEARKADKQSEVGVEKPSYVVLFKHSGQISNDYWDVWTETKICTRETTVGEIEDWYKKKLNNMPDVYLSVELTKAST